MATGLLTTIFCWLRVARLKKKSLESVFTVIAGVQCSISLVLLYLHDLIMLFKKQKCTTISKGPLPPAHSYNESNTSHAIDNEVNHSVQNEISQSISLYLVQFTRVAFSASIPESVALPHVQLQCIRMMLHHHTRKQ